MQGSKYPQNRWSILMPCVATLAIALYVLRAAAWGEVDVSDPTERDPIVITADYAQSWQQNGESIGLLRGRCHVVQGSTNIRSNKIVVWRRTEGAPGSTRERLTVYLEDDVRLEQPGSTLTERTLLLDLVTRGGVTVQTLRPATEQVASQDALYVRGLKRRTVARQAVVHQTQYAPEAAPGPELRSVQLQTPGSGLRRIRVFPRSGVRFNVESFESKNSTPPEQVWILSGGINLLVDGVEGTEGTVDLSADRMVIWTQMGTNDNDFAGETIQTSETPLQVYLEGNIIIRQGTNTLRAAQGFYDAREERAIVHNAELKTRVPAFPLNIRLRADTIRQLARNTYEAQNAWITTSEFGKPGYRLQSTDIYLEPRYGDFWVNSDQPRVDPETGEEIGDEFLWATTLNNKFLVGEVPLFYYPYLSFPAEDPNIPIRNLRFGRDRIFGTQIYTTWNMFKLLGIGSPGNVEWNGHLDYLSDRGVQYGTSGNYSGQSRLGLDGPFQGQGEALFIQDQGLDDLGAGRMDLKPETEDRGRIRLRDRQQFPYELTLQSELGWLSDRNFLEQYNKNEFDTGKDYESLLYLKQQQDNWAWTGLARGRLYDFYTQTEWLPRGDLYVLSEPLFGDLMTWSTHSYAGYGNQRIATAPTNPQDPYTVLPFEANIEGAVLMTRQELNAPFDLGPVHVVPYAIGDATYWGEDLTGNSLTRLWGSAGVRGSLEFWRVMPQVYSGILGLNGLAHKMVIDADFGYSESNQPFSQVPQYNEFDENAQEQFRRRLVLNSFGGVLPPTADPRFYSIRAGAGAGVTAPWHELVTDQQALRLGWRHRLQTKAGPVNNQRIRNWMTLDLETTFFPNAQRDNFDEDFGLYGGRYAWYVSERTSLQASTYFDTFDNGQKLWSVGWLSQRSTRGSVYLGLRNVELANLESQIVTASFSYTMSPKWISTLGTAYDLAEQRDLGQTLSLTRVGADFLVHFGFAADPNRDNVGFGISVEPRFAPFTGASGTQLSSLLAPTPQPGR